MNIRSISPRVELCLQVGDTLNVEPEIINSDQWQAWFQRWSELLMPESGDYELTLRLTDDAEIQALNTQYRKIDRPTDVLAFAASEVEFPVFDEPTEPVYLGDIVISLTTATQQAQAQGHELLTELAWLASHGFLHLLGWDHPDADSLTTMISEQKKCLEGIGLGLGPGSEF
ncbi:rRNA maturation RNase YbeY [Synechococcus sp. PCC 6312]|uniref:rRNA maturation RNase YbeY n=1 Tax=Synechococcus sp. (strain ATCC 27167 / PCC 6312) TaxID=195253 RepID=UPI00029F396B|nr:rRNA maturation RNase YbeY [Synechococcus sp. PCC 6312]AFY62124.1 metalloprotein, YbeY/UPF0054 family [Synechococcus sp. PCC 6312]